MTNTTQRFLTFELGRGNNKKLKIVFNTCLVIFCIISFIVFILAETIGLWFLKEKLNIPLGRENSAFWVYQFSIISSIITILTIPYNAAVIAHEKMDFFAYISIIEVFFKLIIVYILMLISFDKLIVYSILLVIILVLTRITYIVYCNKKFYETHICMVFDKILIKEMMGFTSWNMFGSIAWIAIGQGVNILLNLFFGPVVNAARGIAVQVQGAVSQFSTNIQMATNPQITKMYAIEDYDNMHKLIGRTTKFTYFLLLIVSLPILIKTDYILCLWLGMVPPYTVLFVRLILCVTIVDSLANPFMTAASATGNVKKYQIIVGSILLLLIPTSYCGLKWGGEPSLVFVLHIVIAIIAYIARLYIISPLIDLNIKSFILNYLFKCLLVTLCSVPVPLILSNRFTNELLSLIVTCLLSILFIGYFSFLIGFDNNEKIFIKNKLFELKNKIFVKFMI